MDTSVYPGAAAEIVAAGLRAVLHSDNCLMLVDVSLFFTVVYPSHISNSTQLQTANAFA